MQFTGKFNTRAAITMKKHMVFIDACPLYDAKKPPRAHQIAICYAKKSML
jgi:hypothetical protein